MCTKSLPAVASVTSVATAAPSLKFLTAPRASVMRRLLVIDDDESVRHVLTLILRQWNYDVVTAEHGMTGIDVFNREHFDGVLVDLLMPGLNGLEVCRTLREQLAVSGRDVPIWIITGTRTHEAELAAAKLGVRAVIEKPIDWSEFRTILDHEFPC
jgi:CheY-like chemotaxis protein